MIEINKTVKNYLTQLVIIGMIYCCIGIFFIWGILKSAPEFSLMYLPLVVFTQILGYIATIKYPAGGNVNYYFNKHTPTTDEKTLDALIIRYRNKTIITFAVFIVITLTVIFGLKNHNPETFFSFDLFVGTLTLPLISIGMFGIGIKYISAWWNIKRNMRKENAKYTIKI